MEPNADSIRPETLRIRTYPAPILRERADEVDPTPAVLAVADRMIEMMRSAQGIGLAATQVGLRWRVFVADVPPDHESPPSDPPEATDGPEVYINPVVEAATGDETLMEEGCLSLPGIRGVTIRRPTCTISYTTPAGERITRTAAGLLARCWQHEIDHLDGILIMDRMTEEALARIKGQLRALDRRR